MDDFEERQRERERRRQEREEERKREEEEVKRLHGIWLMISSNVSVLEEMLRWKSEKRGEKKSGFN
jgi:hypothetical protein